MLHQLVHASRTGNNWQKHFNLNLLFLERITGMPLKRLYSHTSSLALFLPCLWVSPRMPPLTCSGLTTCSIAAVIVQMVGVSLFMLGFFPVKPTLSGVRFDFLLLLNYSLSFVFQTCLTPFPQSQRSWEFSSTRSRGLQPHHSAPSSYSSQILVPGFILLLFWMISSFLFFLFRFIGSGFRFGIGPFHSIWLNYARM